MENFFNKLLELTECDVLKWGHPTINIEGSKTKYCSTWRLYKSTKVEVDVYMLKTLWLWYRIVVEDRAYWFWCKDDGPVQKLYTLLEKREADREHNDILKEREEKNTRINALLKLKCKES